MLILSETDVKRVFDATRCLEQNKRALVAIATQTATVPTRLGLPGPHTGDWSLFKPACLESDTSPSSSSMGIKVVSVRSQNPTQNLPLVPASILHMNAHTGMVEAVVAGTFLTAARTAAGSALAVAMFATRPIHHVVLFGAGLQALLHVQMILAAIQQQDKLPRVTILNRGRERAEGLRRELLDRKWAESVEIGLLHTDNVGTILESASVVCTCTNATEPLWGEMESQKIPGSCVITGIGSYTPEMREVPPSTVDRCRVFVDTPEAQTVGDLADCNSQGIKLLGEALRKNQPGSGDGPFFYKAVGTAIQDVLSAGAIVQAARQQEIGTTVDMD